MIHHDKLPAALALKFFEIWSFSTAICSRFVLRIEWVEKFLLPGKVIEFNWKKNIFHHGDEAGKIKILSKLWKIGERIWRNDALKWKIGPVVYVLAVCVKGKKIQFGFCGILQENDRNQCTVEINFPGILKTFSSPLSNINDSEKKLHQNLKHIQV